MKQIPIMFVALALAASAVRAQDAGVIITRATARLSRVAPAEKLHGTVRVQPLFDTTATTRAYGATVSFDAGARTAWHTHPRGQVLIVTEGVGRVQRSGAPTEEIRPGDVVRIPPNVRHWHGAAPTAPMSHVAIVEYLDGRSTDRMEKVSDTQYGAPARAQAVSRERAGRRKGQRTAFACPAADGVTLLPSWRSSPTACSSATSGRGQASRVGIAAW